MAIQKITPSFGATLKGDYKEIIKISSSNGLSGSEINNALREIHSVCPQKSDNVYLYYRNVYRVGYDCDEYAGIRSGIKVYKDGKVQELNVNPNILPKYLFPVMALRVKQLVTGKINPDETIKIYN